MSYIGANEFVFNNDKESGIHSGGFSVNSIMMKGGISPIMTLNSSTAQTGGANNVSDLFNDLVVPNWVLSYPTIYGGGGTDYRGGDNSEGGGHIDYESDEEDDVIDDDIHERLLDLVRQDDAKMQNKKKRATKKNIKLKAPKLKGGTKRQKY
jgi:hypothetical protein